MKFVLLISNLMIPLVFAGIVLYGVLKKVKVYDSFISGAKDGFKTILDIMPTILGLMIAVGILRSSGFLQGFVNFISPLCKMLGFPEDALPLTLMRIISSSASTGLLLDLFKTYGPDSFIGRFVSVMMSSTETVFYTVSLYFLSVKITKTRYTISGALLTNAVGVIASLFITELIFGK